GGGDYWAVDSQFVSDDDGHEPTHRDPLASFASDARIDLTPMVHNGNQFVPGKSVILDTPFEGDAVISPSSRLLLSRVAGPEGKQLGYVLRRVVATPGADGYSAEAPEIARYCTSGGKPAFSYDERWMAIHHYVNKDDAIELGFSGPDDPAFHEYRSKGTSN